jgi:predicted ATPase/class 3 adenylate cyclase
MSNNSNGPDGSVKQRLAAIFAADVVAYSRLMADDQRETLADLDASRQLFRQAIESHGGHIVDMAGDSILAAFDTASGAVYAALAAQSGIAVRTADVAEERKMLYRIGIHLGEILEKEDGSIYGDGVNVAARLEGLAPSGGVTVSKEIQSTVANNCSASFHDQGEFEVKNIAQPVRVFLVAEDDGPASVMLAGNNARLAAKGNVPIPNTTLIGREDELQQVKSILDSHRLVTLFGMGGMGKTRLSLELASQTGAEYPDGTWFIDLAAVTESEAIAPAVAGVFGVTQQAGKSVVESLVEALAGRRLLLVMDNCEHVHEPAAKLSDAILKACSQIKIIATSREALSIAGEQVFPLSPLDVDSDSCSAVELFVERALAVSPKFSPDKHVEDVRQICADLDGIPLAIELAAARVRSLSPKQINERLAARFRLLTGGSTAVRERHQTLRQAVQWSYDLLTEDECTVLNRASVFAGGFSLAAAEAVCAEGDISDFDVCDILDSLVAKSLLTVEQSDDAVRYGILETIRTFGAEQLAESEDRQQAVFLAHGRLYASESDDNFVLWRSPRELEAYEWLDLEINNLRKALRWSIRNNEVDVAARIASNVGDMGRFRLLEEAANWAEDVVDMAREARHPRLAVLLTWCASSAWAYARFDDAKRFGDEAVALLGQDEFDPFVWAYGDLAFVSMFKGDLDGAIKLLQTGANSPVDEHDRFMMAFLLYIMGTGGRTEEAMQVSDEYIEKVDAAGVPFSIAVAYGGKGAAIEAWRPDEALAAYEHSIEVARECGAKLMESFVGPRIAALHARGGDPLVALHGFERMLIAFGDATDILSVSAWRASLVVLFTKLGQFTAAATLYGTFEDKMDASGVVPMLPEAVETVQKKLGTKIYTAAKQSGAAMPLREASNYAFVQIRLGLANLADGTGNQSA